MGFGHFGTLCFFCRPFLSSRPFEGRDKLHHSGDVMKFMEISCNILSYLEMTLLRLFSVLNKKKRKLRCFPSLTLRVSADETRTKTSCVSLRDQAHPVLVLVASKLSPSPGHLRTLFITVGQNLIRSWTIWYVVQLFLFPIRSGSSCVGACCVKVVTVSSTLQNNYSSPWGIIGYVVQLFLFQIRSPCQCASEWVWRYM